VGVVAVVVTVEVEAVWGWEASEAPLPVREMLQGELRVLLSCVRGEGADE
jgi:hypothetical protein